MRVVRSWRAANLNHLWLVAVKVLIRLQGHVLSRIRSEGSGDRKILQAEVEAGAAVWSVDFPFPFFSHLSDSYAFPLSDSG